MKILKPNLAACYKPDQRMPMCKTCLRNKEGKSHKFFMNFPLKLHKTYGTTCVGFLIR